jgi:hypothetical protein
MNKTATFKIGDRVKVVNDKMASTENIGTYGKITELYEDGYYDIELEGMRENEDDTDYVAKGDIEKVNKNTKSKSIKVNFLLKYDLDEDPIEEFETMKQVNARIKELLEDESLDRNSMVVYEVKAKKTVKFDTKIVIS